MRVIGQALEVRLVEVGRDEPQAVLRSPLAEPRRLGGASRRGEAVQVDEVPILRAWSCTPGGSGRGSSWRRPSSSRR